jgi:hypothetical protein
MGTGIYFGSYESSKYLLSNIAPPGPWTYAASGALCGIVAWCVVFPIDTAKSIVQRDILIHEAGVFYRKKNLWDFNWMSRRMYRGMSYVPQIPACSVCLTTGSRSCEVRLLTQLTLPSTKEYERKSLHGNRNHHLQLGFEGVIILIFTRRYRLLSDPRAAVTVGGDQGGGGVGEWLRTSKSVFFNGSPFINIHVILGTRFDVS